MKEMIAVALLLPFAAGTWWLSRHLHPGLLILAGVGVQAFGSWMVLGLHGGLFFTLLQILGTIVTVHGIILWVKRERKPCQPTSAGDVASRAAPEK